MTTRPVPNDVCDFGRLVLWPMISSRGLVSTGDLIAETGAPPKMVGWACRWLRDAGWIRRRAAKWEPAR